MNITKKESLLSLSIFIIGVIMLFSVGGCLGLIIFGLLLFIASILLILFGKTDISFNAAIIFWIISIISLTNGIIECTKNKLYGGISGLVVFSIVMIYILVKINEDKIKELMKNIYDKFLKDR